MLLITELTPSEKKIEKKCIGGSTITDNRPLVFIEATNKDRNKQLK